MQKDKHPISVLMIDDDNKLQDLLSDFFPLFNMSHIRALDGESGLIKIKDKSPDIVVLDIMMPGIDGFETCKEIRKFTNVPVIILSARGATMDRIVGLELGADDFMSKPFEPRELVARIQAILRRFTDTITSKKLLFNNLEIKPLERECYISGIPIGLTSMEFELLYYFVQNPGVKFSRDELLNHLQGIDSNVFSRSIDILISRLRAKLGESAKSPMFIKSVHGYGYVFIGEAL